MKLFRMTIRFAFAQLASDRGEAKSSRDATLTNRSSTTRFSDLPRYGSYPSNVVDPPLTLPPRLDDLKVQELGQRPLGARRGNSKAKGT